MAYFGCINKSSPIPPVEKVYYADFTGQGYIDLPITLKSTHKITVDFLTYKYINNMPIWGNTSGYTSNHLTYYDNKYYVGGGSVERNFSADLVGRHTFVFNNNGVCLFDDSQVLTITSTTSSNTYRICGRSGTSVKYNGRIYYFKIEDLSDGSIVCEIKPMEYNGNLVFRDIINEVNYTCTGMTILEEEYSNDISDKFNILYISQKYTTATWSHFKFDFSINESSDIWSSSAVLKSTSIDLTDYSKLRIHLTINSRTDNGYFWVNVAPNNYSWSSSEFPSVYKQNKSLLQIDNSGTYEIDVSEFTGNNYIYLGCATGKNSVNPASEDNTLNGTIDGYLQGIELE